MALRNSFARLQNLRNLFDRRSPVDRRIADKVGYFLEGGWERRSYQERRSLDERRNDWIRVSEWSSIWKEFLDSED
jgi:hypothetical protein